MAEWLDSTNELRLTSGRVFYGLPGLPHPDGDWLGPVATIDDDVLPLIWFTAEERAELSEYMAAAWRRWAVTDEALQALPAGEPAVETSAADAAPIAFRWGPGGALVTDKAIPGITQELDGECVVYYGGRYLVAETLSPGAAAALVAALGGVLQEQPQHEGGSNV